MGALEYRRGGGPGERVPGNPHWPLVRGRARSTPAYRNRFSSNTKLPREIWSANYPLRTMKRGQTLRIQAPAPFRLHCSQDGWSTVHDLLSTSTALGIDYVDLPSAAGDAICFTFFWIVEERWEGVDYEVRVTG